MFQESWCPLIKAGELSSFAMYDLKRDPGQAKDVSRQFPVQFEQLKRRAIALHKELMEEAVDWSDPKSVADSKRKRTMEEQLRIHRLSSTNRSTFDAFTYINRIPENPDDAESHEDFSARIFSRLANQEGRILLKLPPGMSIAAYKGYKTFMSHDGESSVGNCAACHTPSLYTDKKSHVVSPGEATTKTPSLRNMASSSINLQTALKHKLAVAKKKQAGKANDVSDTYSKIKLNNDDDVKNIIAFLNLLQDKSDDEFRQLILNAKVADVTR